MKLRLRQALLALFIAPLLVFAYLPNVLAVEDDRSTNTAQEEQKTEPTEAEKQTLEKEKKLQERIEQHKKELQEKLKDLNENRIKTRCKAAQGLISQTNERSGIRAVERTQKYDEINEHLTKIITRLKASNIDTSALEQQQVALAAKVAEVKTNINTYKQNLSDLKEMDCTKDPVGFKAALEAARNTRDDLIKQISGIKSYIKDTIKPTLQALKAQLEQQED